ncbi:MAG: SDR family NAD(P)-dependent oxidoreductase [Verrucomicrobia bacterium]|jgi:NAD(P)-dependent dehydrogenase (short-subunit alcohol dehydrogenase family)|nr:SDR family NAD(P)-dependent oxidoreductase [Verrucomicrobiota bacterium]
MKVLITGASSGIGAAAAARFARAGWRVVLTGRDEPRLSAVLQSLPGQGHSGIEADVVDWAEDPKQIPDFGALDAMVWSAGICQLAPGMLLRRKVIRETLAINLEAPLVVTSHLYRSKALVDGARVVWLGSESAHEAGEGFSVYAASKGGLGAAARVLAKEYARRRVALHCIEPGTVDTPMTDALIEQFDGLKDGHADNMENPESVADRIYQLCQE